MTDAKKPFHERVAETLIAQLEAGTAPWQRPWSAGTAYLPMNPLSGKRYQGINALQLLSQGRGDQRWMTYRQAESLGAQVHKGEKGTSIQYWKFNEQQIQRDASGKPILGADGTPQKVTVILERPRVFYAVVFNAEQIEGLPALEQKARTWNPVERADTIMRNSRAEITHGGDRAFYSPAKDSIRLPAQEQFPSAADYYATALHELGHWTGHPSRLDRDLVHAFGSEGYAREELRAEIASMILGDELGLGHDPGQHAAYVGHWVAVLKKDPLEIFRAASAAEKIRDFVMGFEQEQVQTQASDKPEGEITTMNPAAEHVVNTKNAHGEQPRTYIAVPYAEREEAKALGARWDRGRKSWYVIDDAQSAALARWSPKTTADSVQQDAGADRIYLAVPYAERSAAFAAGALWDGSMKSWYVPADAATGELERWLPERIKTEQSPAMPPHEELAVALRETGFVVVDGHPVMNGQPQRVPVEGDRKGERSGFYVAHLDGHPAGYLKNNRTGVEIRWKAKGYALDDAAKATLHAEAATKQQRRAAQQDQRHEESATRLGRQIAGLSAPTLPTPYMQSKGIGTHPGVYTDDGRTTCVPAVDVEGKLWTVQYISAEGTKRFAKSSRKHGCFHPVGGLASVAASDVLIIAEGYATAATCSELLGKPTVAAFDAGNLIPVAQALHAKHPDKPVLIVADDDQAQERERGLNPGRQKAAEAAKAVGGRVVLPIFAPAEQSDNPKRFTDFNDLAVRSVLGRDGAAAQLRHACEQALAERAQRHEPQRVEQTRARRQRAQAR